MRCSLFLGFLALLCAVGDGVIFLHLLLSSDFFGNLLHSGTATLKCVVAADVVRVDARSGVRRHILPSSTSMRTVLISIFHDTVDKQSSIDACSVIHAVRPFSVTLFFVVTTLRERTKFKVNVMKTLLTLGRGC